MNGRAGWRLIYFFFSWCRFFFAFINHQQMQHLGNFNLSYSPLKLKLPLKSPRNLPFNLQTAKNHCLSDGGTAPLSRGLELGCHFSCLFLSNHHATKAKYLCMTTLNHKLSGNFVYKSMQKFNGRTMKERRVCWKIPEPAIRSNKIRIEQDQVWSVVK